MFRNYLTVALRNLAKHRLYSFINIAGLAVALTSAMLIMLFVRDELSFDKTFPGYEDVYRAEITFFPPDREPLVSPASMHPLGEALISDITGVRDMARLGFQTSSVRFGDKQFFEQVSAGNSNLLEIVQIPLIRGDRATALSRPDTAVISQRLATKYFGDEDPIGKIITLDADKPVEIVAVMEDIPHNSHLDTDLIIPLGSQADRIYGPKGKGNVGAENWGNINYFTYFRLQPGVSVEQVIAQTPDMIRRRVTPASFGMLSGTDMATMIVIRAAPYGDLHFAEGPTMRGKPSGDMTTVYGFTVIAGLILLIACINFMNLATARATQRAREVGMRKALGASRRQLVVQFLGESVLISLLALVLALAFVELLLPAYGSFLQRPISLDYVADWDFVLAVLATAIVTGLLGGLYPALILSGFRPAAVLKSNHSGQSGSGSLRAALVIMQFAISIALGITSAVVYAQTLFAQSYDVGFTRENMLVLTGTSRDQVKPLKETLRNELAAHPNVLGIAESGDRPFGDGENNTVVILPERPDDPVLIRHLVIDPDFLNVYGIKLVAGRNLTRDRGEDVRNVPDESTPEPDNLSILINEAAVRRMGFASPQDAIGKIVREDGSPPGQNGVRMVTRTIVGVVSDIHFDSLRRTVLPTRYVFSTDDLGVMTLRVKGEGIAATRAFVEDVWTKLVPNLPVRLTFLDEAYQSLYDQDQRRGEMFALFTGFAIFIACLGLFGLAAFTAERRTKEIGVRKVFGAKVRDIVFLLLWQFSKPVLIANLIAWPIAWFYLNDWLSGFAYRIDLGPSYFVLSGLAALAIAWATVTLHSLKVARAKPVHALRYE